MRFWGVRDSIAAPGSDTVKYGGNTACVEIRCGDDTVVLECGTGARELGRDMMKRLPLKLHVLFSDYRWDHIQGFPFFTPVYIPTSEIHVYGPKRGSSGVKDMLAAQMKFPVFPIQLEHLNAKFTWNDIGGNTRVEAGKMVISGMPVGTSVAYRIEGWSGQTVVCLPEAAREIAPEKLTEFCRGARLLVVNGSVDPKLNGRHLAAARATWDAAVKLARGARARKLVLFHHSPEDDDRTIGSLEKRARKTFAGAIAASEGMTLAL